MVGSILSFDNDCVGFEFFRSCDIGLVRGEGGEAGRMGGGAYLFFANGFQDFPSYHVLDLWFKYLRDFDVGFVWGRGFRAIVP